MVEHGLVRVDPREGVLQVVYKALNDALDGAPKYVKYQIFIGGATSTAKHRGLKELSEKDFHKNQRV